MRLVYTSDLHGNKDKYQQLLDLAQTQHVQGVIVGGDLLPPAIKVASAVQSQHSFITTFLKPLLADFCATQPDTAVYLLAGNDDWAAAIKTLDDLEAEYLAYPLHQRTYALGSDLWLAGYACVPITPFSIKDYERTEDDVDVPPYSFAMAYVSDSGEPVRTTRDTILRRPTIDTELRALARCSNPARTIYVTHTPPYDTALDVGRKGRHLGSRALRAFIEQYQPPLTLHGHIHESPHESGHYAEQSGGTWSINPGSERERLHAVILDTDDIAGTLWHTIYGALS
jgi:Icc-related predicted phosphoesterase